MKTENAKNNLINTMMKMFAQDNEDKATIVSICENIYILGVSHGILGSGEEINGMCIDFRIKTGNKKEGDKK